MAASPVNGKYTVKLQLGLDQFATIEVPLEEPYDAVIEYLRAHHDDRAAVIGGTHKFSLSYPDEMGETLVVDHTPELLEAIRECATLAVNLVATGAAAGSGSGSLPPSAPAVAGQSPPQLMVNQWMALPAAAPSEQPQSPQQPPAMPPPMPMVMPMSMPPAPAPSSSVAGQPPVMINQWTSPSSQSYQQQSPTPSPSPSPSPVVAAASVEPAAAVADPYSTLGNGSLPPNHDDDNDSDGEEVLDDQQGRQREKKEGQPSPSPSPFNSVASQAYHSQRDVVEGYPDLPRGMAHLGVPMNGGGHGAPAIGAPAPTPAPLPTIPVGYNNNGYGNMFQPYGVSPYPPEQQTNGGGVTNDPNSNGGHGVGVVGVTSSYNNSSQPGMVFAGYYNHMHAASSSNHPMPPVAEAAAPTNRPVIDAPVVMLPQPPVPSSPNVPPGGAPVAVPAPHSPPPTVVSMELQQHQEAPPRSGPPPYPSYADNPVYQAASNSATVQRPSSNGVPERAAEQQPVAPPAGIISQPLDPNNYYAAFDDLSGSRAETAVSPDNGQAARNAHLQQHALYHQQQQHQPQPAVVNYGHGHGVVIGGQVHDIGSPLSQSGQRRMEQSAGMRGSEATPLPSASIPIPTPLMPVPTPTPAPQLPPAGPVAMTPSSSVVSINDGGQSIPAPLPHAMSSQVPPVSWSPPGVITPHPHAPINNNASVSPIAVVAVSPPPQAVPVPPSPSPTPLPAAGAAVVSPMSQHGGDGSAHNSGRGASFGQGLDIRSNDGSFSIRQQQPNISASLSSNGSNGSGGASVKQPCARLVAGKECKLMGNAAHVAKFNHVVCPYFLEEGSCQEVFEDIDHASEFVHPTSSASIIASVIQPPVVPPVTPSAVPVPVPVVPPPVIPIQPQVPPQPVVPLPAPVAAQSVPVAVFEYPSSSNNNLPPQSAVVDPFAAGGAVVTPAAAVVPPQLPPSLPPSLPVSRPPPLPSSAIPQQGVPPQQPVVVPTEACPFGHECALMDKPAHVARWHQPGAAHKLSFGSSRLSEAIRAVIGDRPLPLVCPFGDICPLLRAGDTKHCSELRHPCVIDAMDKKCRQIDLPAHFAMWTHKNDHQKLYRRSGEAAPPVRAPCGWPCTMMTMIPHHAYDNSHPCLAAIRGECKDESVAHRTYYRHPCPDGGKCALLAQEDQDHMRRMLHPCRTGASCMSKSNPVHWKLWYHSDWNFPDAKLNNNTTTLTSATGAAVNAAAANTPVQPLLLRPICPNPYPCPHIRAHGAEFRHPCMMLMATGQCSQKHDPAHRQLWRELCPEGDKCTKAANGIEEHKSEWLHPCEHGAACGGQTDAKHTLYYYHPKPPQPQPQLPPQQPQQPQAQNAAVVNANQPQQPYPSQWPNQQPQHFQGYPNPPTVAGQPYAAAAPTHAPVAGGRRIVPLTGKPRCTHSEPWSCPAKNNPDHQAQFSHPCLAAIIQGTCTEMNNPEHTAAFVHPCPNHPLACPELKTNPDHKLDTLHECPMFGKGFCRETGLTHGGIWYHKPATAAPTAAPTPPVGIPPQLPPQLPPSLPPQLPHAVPVQASLATSVSQLQQPAVHQPVAPVAAPTLPDPCYGDQPPNGCPQIGDPTHRRLYRHICREPQPCARLNPSHPEFHAHIAEWYHVCPLDAYDKCAPATRTPQHNYQFYHKPSSMAAYGRVAGIPPAQ